MLGHAHAVALLATDAINAAHCSGTKICCPGQLGVCPAVLRVGFACRPIAITDALRRLTDGNRTYYTQTTDLRHPMPVTSLYALCLDQDLLVLCWSSLKLQHTS